MSDTRDPLIRVVEERNQLRRENRALRAVVDSMPSSYIEAWSNGSEAALIDLIETDLSRAGNSQSVPRP